MVAPPKGIDDPEGIIVEEEDLDEGLPDLELPPELDAEMEGGGSKTPTGGDDSGAVQKRRHLRRQRCGEELLARRSSTWRSDRRSRSPESVDTAAAKAALEEARKAAEKAKDASSIAVKAGRGQKRG